MTRQVSIWRTLFYLHIYLFTFMELVVQIVVFLDYMRDMNALPSVLANNVVRTVRSYVPTTAHLYNAKCHYVMRSADFGKVVSPYQVVPAAIPISYQETDLLLSSRCLEHRIAENKMKLAQKEGIVQDLSVRILGLDSEIRRLQERYGFANAL